MIGKIIGLLDKYFEEVLCAVCLATMSSCIMLQVILRYVFGEASAWVEEISIIGMIGSVYFGAALAVRNKDHLRIVFILNLLPKYLKNTYDYFGRHTVDGIYSFSAYTKH